jgi:phosphate transport system substrate-binding protein
VRQFIEFYMTEGPSLAAEAGFVPLPKRASQLALGHFQDGRLGSVFGGTPEVGVTIEELLEREAKP